jgi:hypothetical protein
MELGSVTLKINNQHTPRTNITEYWKSQRFKSRCPQTVTPTSGPDWDGRPACDSDKRVTVNNIQVILVCGRPGDLGCGTETPAASVPRHKVQARHARYSEIRNQQWVIFAEGNRIVKYCVVVSNYLFGVSKNSQLPFLGSFLVWMALFAKKTWLREKSRVISGTDNGVSTRIQNGAI